MYNAILDISPDNYSGSEPVTLAEVKAAIRVDPDITEDDTYISKQIIAARQTLEEYLNIGLVSQDRQVVFVNGCGGIELPLSPITSTVSISFIDYTSSGVTITGCTPYVVGLQSKQVFPAFEQHAIATYTSGYVICPEVFREAIICQVAYMYEHRGDEQDTDDGNLCTKAAQLVRKYRKVLNDFTY